MSKTSLLGMTDRWVLVRVKKIYRPSEMWDNLMSDSLDVEFHSSNILEASKIYLHQGATYLAI